MTQTLPTATQAREQATQHIRANDERETARVSLEITQAVKRGELGVTIEPPITPSVQTLLRAHGYTCTDVQTGINEAGTRVAWNLAPHTNTTPPHTRPTREDRRSP